VANPSGIELPVGIDRMNCVSIKLPFCSVLLYQWSNLVGDECVNQIVVVVKSGLIYLIDAPSWQNSRPGKRKSVEIHLTQIFFIKDNKAKI
jgi:hypothetical protein